MRPVHIIEHQPFQPRRSHWGKRLVLGGLLLAVAALGGPYVYFVIHANNRLQDALAEADRLDPGWQLFDLENKRATIPDDQNSAIPLLLAYRLVPPKWPFWYSDKDPENPTRDPNEIADLRNSFEKLDPPAQLDDRQLKELRRELKRAAVALTEARKVVDMPRGRYAITYAPDLISTLLDHTQHTRELTNLLAADALLRAQDQDVDGALESCRGILNIGRSIGDEPTWISMLVRVAHHQVAVGKIERVLAQGQPSEKALALLQRLLEEEVEEPLLLIGARGERALADGMMQVLQSGTVSNNQITAMLKNGSAEQKFEGLELLLPGALKHNRAALLKFNNQLVEIAKRPVEEQKALLNQLTVSATDLPYIARLAAIPQPRIAASYHRDQASLRCAIAMVAVERYRRAQGRWPAVLTDLVPVYLPKVPTDPYDAAPLRLGRFAEGVVIYSVGADGQDNGGKLSERVDEQGTDYGLRLWEVGKRRQPPRSWPREEEK
jgi:hypothetical protein